MIYSIKWKWKVVLKLSAIDSPPATTGVSEHSQTRNHTLCWCWALKRGSRQHIIFDLTEHTSAPTKWNIDLALKSTTTRSTNLKSRYMYNLINQITKNYFPKKAWRAPEGSATVIIVQILNNSFKLLNFKSLIFWKMEKERKKRVICKYVPYK
jgi:hypothetical protein